MATEELQSPVTETKRAAALAREYAGRIADAQISTDVDPEAYEAFGTILAIMRGEIVGKYLGFRLAAASRILEEVRGKPLQRVSHDVGGTLAALVEGSIRRLDGTMPKMLTARVVDVPSETVPGTVIAAGESFIPQIPYDGPEKVYADDLYADTVPPSGIPVPRVKVGHPPEVRVRIHRKDSINARYRDKYNGSRYVGPANNVLAQNEVPVKIRRARASG